MKNEFRVRGFFYENRGYEFRKYLNIIQINSTCSKPDLLVIMMNPGSSKPLNGVENEETDAIPDNTQTQIMKIMKNCGFSYARVLNLSDLREPKSEKFYQKISELKKRNISHSIFEADRSRDYEALFVRNIPVIYAWGVNKKLSDLALAAINRVNASKPIGIKKEDLDYAYYHPLPPNSHTQKEWVEKITDLMKSA